MLVGSYGYGWSSATSGIGGVGFHLSAQGLNSCYSGYRGHGFLLRCLSE
ncbi:hypothetical protein [uncultured Rikenella sp.]|nr:hypothetical protein [uncultured Rikenella sp.]